MSLSNSYPALRPSMLLDFSNSETIDPRITFARASTARFYDQNTVAKAEENLILGSQTMHTSPWENTAATCTENAAAAPDGTATAELLTFTGGGVISGIFQNATVTNALAYTQSLFVKFGTQQWVQLTFGVAVFGAGQYANFDVQNGVLGSVSGTAATITAVGGGWYRLTFTATASSSASTPAVYLLGIDSGTDVRSPALTAAGTTVLIWGAQLEQRSAATAYTATTTAPITRYQPQLMTAAANVARLDHDPITREARGLLIEESRSNLLTFTEGFDNAAWTKTNTSITTNTVIAPDGALTADKLVETTASDFHFVDQTFSASDNVTHTFSVYAKAAERTFFNLRLRDKSSVAKIAVFDLLLGTTASPDATITSVGGGWYRCTLTGSSGTGGATPRALVYSMVNSTTSSYTGDGYSGIFIWGAQLEAGAFATSYIARLDATAASRAADAASMTGTNFSSWYRADEGAIYAETMTLAAGGNKYMAEIGDGTTANRFSFTSHPTTQEFYAVIGGTIQASLLQTMARGPMLKSVASYRVNDVAMASQGTLGPQDASVGLPAVNALFLGSARLSAAWLNGHIKKFAYYPARLTNAQLQALTR